MAGSMSAPASSCSDAALRKTPELHTKRPPGRRPLLLFAAIGCSGVITAAVIVFAEVAIIDVTLTIVGFVVRGLIEQAGTSATVRSADIVNAGVARQRTARLATAPRALGGAVSERAGIAKRLMRAAAHHAADTVHEQ